MPSLYVNCPIMVWVGFMGGAAYVNVIHNLHEIKTLKNNEREVAITLSLMFNDVGCLSSAIFSQIMDITIFKGKNMI